MTTVYAVSQHDFLSWVLVAAVALMIVVVTIAIIMGATSFLTPRLERLQKGQSAQPGEKPCCPPGAGCNDPLPNRRACRRDAVMQFGDTEEVSLMEKEWTLFNGTPKGRPARKKHLAAYGSIRDKIFFAHVAAMAASGGSTLTQLTSPEIEDAGEGEVMPDKSDRRKERF